MVFQSDLLSLLGVISIALVLATSRNRSLNLRAIMGLISVASIAVTYGVVYSTGIVFVGGPCPLLSGGIFVALTLIFGDSPIRVSSLMKLQFVAAIFGVLICCQIYPAVDVSHHRLEFRLVRNMPAVVGGASLDWIFGGFWAFVYRVETTVQNASAHSPSAMRMTELLGATIFFILFLFIAKVELNDFHQILHAGLVFALVNSGVVVIAVLAGQNTQKGPPNNTQKGPPNNC